MEKEVAVILTIIGALAYGATFTAIPAISLIMFGLGVVVSIFAGPEVLYPEVEKVMKIFFWAALASVTSIVLLWIDYFGVTQYFPRSMDFYFYAVFSYGSLIAMGHLFYFMIKKKHTHSNE
ncbi:MAG: hypothetical protein WD335_01935 [Candidatus Paceibacterota bacterium]